MLFMHYQFYFTIGIDFYFSKTSVLDNFLAILLDVTFVFLVSFIISWGRVKTCLTITFMVTLLLSYFNVIYSRFFGQYLTLSAIEQVGSLTDNVVIKSVLSEIKLIDIFYLISLLLYCFILFRNKKISLTYRNLVILRSVWAIVIVLILICHSIYLINGSYERAVQTLFPSLAEDSNHPNWENVYPNWATFHKGLLRKVVVDNLLEGSSHIQLNKEEKVIIEKECKNNKLRVTGKTADGKIQNVIFILAESYLSVLSDLWVDGQEITPYLNALKRDSNVYYNGHVQPNAKIGKSSDGQLIYMTGLLPLRSEVTVSCAKNDSLVGLPNLLLKQGIVKYSQILVPTSPSIWEQSHMNKVYNIEMMYSKNDYTHSFGNDDLSDEEIFDFAKQLDAKMPSYSFSLLLSLSMHEPYDEYVEHGFLIKDKSLPNRYRNYLITSHYFDEQIGKYIEHLKTCGLYDRSLIIIASDHEPHLSNMDVEEIISCELPLYIINGGFDINKVWSGSCNQLDIYTTILDILGVNSDWHGLGHTLLNPNYTNSVDDKTWQLSEWIIKGDYFRNRDEDI